MSGLEVLGAIVGVVGFVGQMAHYVRKYKECKKAAQEKTVAGVAKTALRRSGDGSRALFQARSMFFASQRDHNSTTRDYNASVGENSQALQQAQSAFLASRSDCNITTRDHNSTVRENFRTFYRLQQDHNVAVQENFRTFSLLQQNHNEVIRAGIDSMTALHRAHVDHHQAMWTTMVHQHNSYRLEYRQFVCTLMCMACCITFLVYFLGVYTGKNAILGGWVAAGGELRMDSVLDHGEALDMLRRTGRFAWTAGKSVLEGYLYIPVKAPWLIAKSIWKAGSGSASHAILFARAMIHALSSHAGAVSNSTAYNQSFSESPVTTNMNRPMKVEEAAAFMVASTVYSIVGTLLWLWCLPANFLNHLLVTFVQLCGIPAKFTVITIAGLAATALGAVCSQQLKRPMNWRNQKDMTQWSQMEKLARGIVIPCMVITFLVIPIDRGLAGLLGWPRWLAYSLDAVPWALLLWDGTRCKTCLWFCMC